MAPFAGDKRDLRDLIAKFWPSSPVLWTCSYDDREKKDLEKMIVEGKQQK